MFKKTVLLLLGSSALLVGHAEAENIFDYLDENQYNIMGDIDQNGGNQNINHASKYL